MQAVVAVAVTKFGCRADGLAGQSQLERQARGRCAGTLPLRVAMADCVRWLRGIRCGILACSWLTWQAPQGDAAVGGQVDVEFVGQVLALGLQAG